VTAYIAVRFRPASAIGGIAATLHDVLVTLACLAFTGYDQSFEGMAITHGLGVTFARQGGLPESYTATEVSAGTFRGKPPKLRPRGSSSSAWSAAVSTWL
jgi:hypothetical protein